MSRKYQQLRTPRFTVEQVEGGEQIRIRAPRRAFVLVFLPLWLAAWSIAVVAGVYQLVTTQNPLFALWLCVGVAGWVYGALTLGWMLFGSETLRVRGGDLELAHHLLGWSRRRIYPGGEIRNLRGGGQTALPLRTPALAFLRDSPGGAVRFDHGARTIHAAAALDDAEGQMIVDRLIKWLPASVRPA